MSKMLGVAVTDQGCVLKEHTRPEPRAGEVLIQNVAVASNPKDWKRPAWNPGYEQIEGNDVAGYVAAVGEGVQGFEKGDKVLAFTRILDPRGGAYAEYSIAPASTVALLGPKSDFKDAAALPLAFLTAAIALFWTLKLPMPEDTPTLAITRDPISILLYGASTTVGVYAIQLAKMSGLHVVGIAGAGCAHAQSYGADVVINYCDKTPSQLSAEIQAAVRKHPIQHAFDAVSEGGTERIIAEGLQPSGGTATQILPISDDKYKGLPDNVVFKPSNVRWVHDPSVGEGIEAFGTRWLRLASKWLEEGRLRPQKTTIVPGGLAGVDEGLRRLKAGEVSSEKLIYIVADTPGL